MYVGIRLIQLRRWQLWRANQISKLIGSFSDAGDKYPLSLIRLEGCWAIVTHTRIFLVKYYGDLYCNKLGWIIVKIVLKLIF